MPGKLLHILWFVLLLCACSTPATPSPEAPLATAVTAAPTATTVLVSTAEPTVAGEPILAERTTRTELEKLIPALAEREAQFVVALTLDPPIVALPEDALDEAGRQAQALALQDARFTSFSRTGPANIPLRNEIMGVRPALPSDYDETTAAICKESECYRVELYNYAFNVASVGIVDLKQSVVLAVSHQADTQPDIPKHLTDLATQIAINSPEVAEALGYKPGADKASMPNIKTALRGTYCERSRHLCVAPTFIEKGRALWAIVDLTDGVLVGTRWTELGENSATVLVTEESLQDEVISERFCEKSTVLEQAGWALEYLLTSSDGLMISNVRFGDRLMMRNAKLVDWHVSYSGTDQFGYSDAVGCPIFSAAAVVAFNGPQVQEIRQNDQVVGFALVQDFRNEQWPQPCNYRYEQRYEFYNDGRFRVGGANHGRGCGLGGIYRPVLRIDIVAGGDGAIDTVSEWDGKDWQNWQTEKWQLQTPQTTFTEQGYQYRVVDSGGAGFYIEPGRGQFGDGGRGDNNWFYVTQRHADLDEGDADLITIGPCCNDDFAQGPEKFMQPAEPIIGQDLVLWYVAQLVNDDRLDQEYCWADAVVENGMVVSKTWPCAFGPMFVPIEATE